MQGPFYLDILTADEDHAVIMFEVGKLSEGQMDQFQGGPGEDLHMVYISQQPNLGLDLVRCESLQSINQRIL